MGAAAEQERAEEPDQAPRSQRERAAAVVNLLQERLSHESAQCEAAFRRSITLAAWRLPSGKAALSFRISFPAMKIPVRPLFAGLAFLLSLSLSCFAERSGGSEGPQFGSDPALKELFKRYPGFMAEVQVDMTQKGSLLSMFIALEWNKGKSRTEMDLTTLKSADMPAGSIQQMVDLGFSPMVSLSKEDDTDIFVLYPALKAYASQHIGKQAQVAKGEAKLATSVLGEEVVDGHPCSKRLVAVLNPPAKPKEFTVWAASDLEEFPVKIEYTEKREPVSIKFTKVRLKMPPADHFNLPEDYTAYKTVQELMQMEISKAMSKMP